MSTFVEHEAASESPPPLERPGSNGDASGSAAQLERAALYKASPELQELCRDNGLSAGQFARRGGAAVATLDMFLGFWRSMKSVMHFPALRELSIVHHPTITALEGLGHCPNLELLCVTECGLEHTRGIERCTRLRTVNLSGNRIRRIEGLETLARLETLWINDNTIERLDGLWKRAQLKQLWAARNRIEHLDAALSGCSSLTDVNLADNRLFSFKSLLSLTSLDQLASLTLSDPHYGDNPVCRLCNYQTYILCHLSGLTCLDTVELSTRNKQIAEATMLKKKMYYNMRIKAIKRDVRARIKHAESLRSHAEQQTELSVAPLVREKKAIERYVADLAVRSETNDGSEGAGIDCQASHELKNKLARIDACLASKYSAIYRMNVDFHRLSTSLQATSDINIARLLLELETGGNIRLEDGKPSDAWFASCVDLVRSRLFPAELHVLGIQDIRINRVTRISNRYLRHRFHARMDELVTAPEQHLKENVSKKGVTVRAKEDVLEDQGGEAKRDPASLETHSADASADPTAPDPDATLESSMEYLFYMQPPQLDHQRRSHELEQFAIAESGFREPSEYAQIGLDGAIKLANSVALLDFPRLATALTVKGRLLQGQQPSHQELCRHSSLSQNRQRELTTEMKEALALAVSGEWDLPSGVLLVVKVFPGYSKSVSPPEETPGSTSQTAGIDARAFPGLQSVQVLCESAALGATPDATAKQKFYYLFDNTLVLPEYLVEYQYTFADRTASGVSKSESNKTPSERSIAARGDVEAPDIGVAVKLADDFERRYRVRRSASPTAGSRCLPQAVDDNVAKVLNMEPVLPIVEPLDNAQVVSLRLGAAEVHRVKHLNLMGCGLEHIPDLACIAVQLEVLVLSYNNLQTINNALTGLAKLRTLDLSFNQLGRLEHLEHCVGLESLEVNNNLLQTFADVEYLGRTFRQRALRHVDLRKNVLCDTKRYRLHVLQHLPTLECLDQQLVTKDEALSAQQLVTKLTAATTWDHCCHQRGRAVGTQPPLSSSDHDSEFEQSWNAVDDIALNRELISEIEGLERARNLRVAAFSDNVIKRISGLETCGKLEELVLEDNEITKIENLQALVSLKKLHLGRNRISVIEGLDALENLTQLSLEENQISSLQGLGAALKLMELYVGNNRIEVLKEIQYLKSLPKLTILELSGNELTRLPDYRLYTIYYLRRVKVLDGVSISPQDQSDAKHKYSGKLTTEFILEKCGSGGSNSARSGSNPLERIQEMDLAGSRIREIGAISGRVFATLRELNLENNQITDISGLETLPKLRVLNLNRNRIEKLLPSSSSAAFPIPDEVEGKGILACLGLEQLYLAYNQICDMTVLGLQFLDDLKVLDLQGNSIVFLAGLGSSTELRELRLDRNRIRQLDSLSTAALRHLRVLTLEDNGLKSLANFATMQSLEMLDMSSNRLVDIEEVDKLTSHARLIDLRLTNNALAKKHLYRQTVVYKLPSLCSLDNREVAAEERERAAVLFAHERASAAASSSTSNNNPTEKYVEARAYTSNAQVTLTPSSIPSKNTSLANAFTVAPTSSSTRVVVPPFSTGEVLAGTLLRKHPLATQTHSQNQNQQQQQQQPVFGNALPKPDHSASTGIAIVPSNTTTRSLLVHSQAVSYRNPNSLTNQTNTLVGGGGGLPPSPAATPTVTVASAFGAALANGLSADHFHLGSLRSDRRRMSSVHYDQSFGAMQVGNLGSSGYTEATGSFSVGSSGELKFPVGIVSSLAVVRGPTSIAGQGRRKPVVLYKVPSSS